MLVVFDENLFLHSKLSLEKALEKYIGKRKKEEVTPWKTRPQPS